MRLPLLAVSTVTLCACAFASPRVAAPVMRPWSHPDGLLTIDMPRESETRAAQEITQVGTVNFRVHRANHEPYSFRVSAFAYPQPGSLPFDGPGDVAHSSHRFVARMSGTVQRDTPVVVDGVHGNEIVFTVFAPDGTLGRGLQRLLISEPPRAARYHAFCLAPADVDFTPCERFVRSMRPRLPAPPAP